MILICMNIFPQFGQSLLKCRYNWGFIDGINCHIQNDYDDTHTIRFYRAKYP